MWTENIHPCEKALHCKGLRFSIVATYKIKRFAVQGIVTPGFCIGLVDEIFMLRQITWWVCNLLIFWSLISFRDETPILMLVALLHGDFYYTFYKDHGFWETKAYSMASELS